MQQEKEKVTCEKSQPIDGTTIKSIQQNEKPAPCIQAKM